MTRTRTRDRLGLMGIASAIALTAAISWSPSAWSADKNAEQIQKQGQSHQTQGAQNQGGQNHGQPQGQNQGQAHNTVQPQFKSGQAQNSQPQLKNSQPQNGQPQSGQSKNGQFVQQGNQKAPWQHNGQAQNVQPKNGQPKNGQFVQQGNQKSQWQNNGQNNNQKNVQVRTANVNTRYNWNDYHQGQKPAQWDQHSHDVDIHTYQWNRNSQQRYHYVHAYVPPHGYYYRRWTYGQVFPTAFWSQNYWLTDYYSYGLVNPPYGYVWVRYGSDALLVNVYNGQILSVDYNVFYA